MKKIRRLFTAVVIIVVVTACPMPSLKTEPDIQFPAFQQAMLDEVNFARTNPTGYAEARLKAFHDQGEDNGAYADLKGQSAIGALTMQKQLCAAAQKYAVYMATHNVFGHNTQGTPQSRCLAEDYTHYSGENIAAGGYPNCNAVENPELAAQVFVIQLIIDKGVSSLGHRKNIMNGSHTHFGCGFCRDESSKYKNYTVQDFGRQ